MSDEQAIQIQGIDKLVAALAKAQAEMRGAAKDSTNPHFRSKYADLASVVDAIRGPLTKHGIAFLQLTHPSDKNEVVIETMLAHESGQKISSILAIPVNKADAQGYGSALTYARRYALAAITGIAPEDDDGNAATTAAPKPETEKPSIPKTLTPYPDAKIDRHLDGWAKRVAEGKNEAEIIQRMNNIINAIQTTHTLTDEQKTRIIDAIYPGGKPNE